ncbi:hypothetical protein ACOMHN_003081 [Nucella lapillus]
MPRRRRESEENNNNDEDEYDKNDEVTTAEICRSSNGRGQTHHKKLHKLHKPIQRNAANARERSRMRVLSKAFSKLKTTLPWVPPDTKLSKLDTLRLASSYIAHLKQILDAEEEAEQQEGRRNTYIHPLNLTWPFTFNGRTAALNESKSPEPIKCPTKSPGAVQC